MQRAPAYWIRPELFLVVQGHELYPFKCTWWAFEHGPRRFIAQGLVMMELKVVLAYMVKERGKLVVTVGPLKLEEGSLDFGDMNIT